MQTDEFIEALSAQLTPVKALPAPGRRAALWLLTVTLLGAAVVARWAHLQVFAERMGSLRVALEWLGTTLTAVSAVISAFELSVPGASRRWLWLPLAPLALWLAMSGWGCLENGVGRYGAEGQMHESAHCFRFILAVSVPLAVALFAMLRRAHPIAPLPVAAYATLGVAASAASVLQFFHPFDVTVIDLASHLTAVAVVFAAGTALRRALLSPA